MTGGNYVPAPPQQRKQKNVPENQKKLFRAELRNKIPTGGIRKIYPAPVMGSRYRKIRKKKPEEA